MFARMHPAARPLVPLLLSASLLAQAAVGPAYVRVHDDVRALRGSGPQLAAATTTGPQLCATLPVAAHGAPVPGGGTLSPIAFGNPACVNRAGAFAFVANVNGASRNQGVFVADAAGLHAIAMGCGGGGGSGQPGTCGDAAPVGGTFAGFFGGTVFAPPIDDRGDVLFFAEVVNGSTTRGLFLYTAATATIVKVAGVGDPSPIGGTFAAIGPGSMNNRGQVAFLAARAGTTNSDLFLWQAGVVTKIAAALDPAPGGGTMQLLGTESFGFQDGTNVPAGPVPAINDCGAIAYRAIVSGGIASRGVIVRAGGVDSWYLKAGDPTPAGGTFVDFQGAALNGSGSIAVFADFNAGTLTSGWFAGRPGAFRKVLAFFDPVDGGQCLGLAFSRNPMTSIDDQENVVLWCDLSSAGGQDRLVVIDPTGAQTVLARRGASTPIGGSYTSINAWPSLSSTGHATLSAGTPGASGGALNAHFASVLCGPGVAASPCTPIGGTLRVDDFGPTGTLFILCVSTATQNLPLPPFGTVLIGPQPLVTLAGPIAYPGSSGPHTLPIAIPANPAFTGAALHFQSLALGAIPTVLTNRASSVLQ
jgi:hypothetical protein